MLYTPAFNGNAFFFTLPNIVRPFSSTRYSGNVRLPPSYRPVLQVTFVVFAEKVLFTPLSFNLPACFHILFVVL
jgi:hypothetical protein